MGFDETQEEHNRKNKSVEVEYWENLKTALNHAINLDKYNFNLSDEDKQIIKEHIKTLESAIKLENGED